MRKINCYSNIFKKETYFSFIIPSVNNILGAEDKLDSLVNFDEFIKHIKGKILPDMITSLRNFQENQNLGLTNKDYLQLKNEYSKETDIYKKLILEYKFIKEFYIDTEDKYEGNEDKYNRSCFLRFLFEFLKNELFKIYKGKEEHLKCIENLKSGINNVIKETIKNINNIDYIFNVFNLYVLNECIINGTFKNLNTITDFLEKFIGEKINEENYINLIKEVFKSFEDKIKEQIDEKHENDYKKQILINNFDFENFPISDYIKNTKENIKKNLNNFKFFEGHLVLNEIKEFDNALGENFFKYFEININKDEYQKLCKDLNLKENDKYLSYLDRYRTREHEIQNLNYNYENDKKYRETFILLDTYFEKVLNGEINGNFIVNGKNIYDIMTNLPNDLYNINVSTIAKLTQILDFTKKIIIVEEKVNRKKSIHYTIIDKEETLSSLDGLIKLNQKYNEDKIKVDNAITDFSNRLVKLKNIIKNSNNILKSLDDKYKNEIDTSKYNDLFFEGILYKDIKSIETEINSLEAAVKKASEDYTKEINAKLEKDRQDKEKADKIATAEKKEKEINGEIEKVCNSYLEEIKDLNIDETFDKKNISISLDQKITELYSTKKYNVNDLTGWKDINNRLLVTIQQLKTECISKCNDEIDKKLKEIADKKAKDLEDQQKKDKEEQDKLNNNDDEEEKGKQQNENSQEHTTTTPTTPTTTKKEYCDYKKR